MLLSLQNFDATTSPLSPVELDHERDARGLRIVSWNLLRKIGARVDDVARLIDRHDVDIALLQEATAEIERLPGLVGGEFVRHEFSNRIHGPALWSRRPLARSCRLPLISGAIERHALIAEIDDIAFANVHLSHGQILCRRQAREAAHALARPCALVIGDFNMIGPMAIAGFDEIGPRETTHMARGVLPVRIDRCFARGFACLGARALDRGRSDHRPIMLDLVPLDSGRRHHA
jgi:endonuclease/exonuclease/phosphatase family metal-dependent hydrolase